jgi:hypothetical protein
MFRYLASAFIIILAAAPALAGSGAGLPASYYFIKERVQALEKFVEQNEVGIPFGSSNARTGIAEGKSAEGPVFLEVTKTDYVSSYRYKLVLSRAKEVEGRTKHNTITFDLVYVTQATGRPQRILLATSGEFSESNNWEIQLDAQWRVTAVSAVYHSPRFVFGGREVRLSASF